MDKEKAIKKSLGPCVILAGAGTGKTYTIVEKIKYLVENNIYAPEKIVCITFSNEAANNLTLRLNKILGAEKLPIIRTFHGFSADLLRKHGDKIDISGKFKILDPDQAKVILHRNFKINAINCHRYIATIGTCKDLGIRLEDFQSFLLTEMKKYESIDLEKKLEDLNFDLQTLHLKKSHLNKKDLLEEIKNIKKLLEIKKFTNSWNAYEKLKKKGNYLDYSDLNTLSLELLKKKSEISSDYSYIVVDEFQDTNKLQLDFLRHLSSSKNITIVGDINQSIYRFRGAYKDNLNIFKKEFSVSKDDIFNLDKSYRSTNKILRVAHKMISNNYINKDECFYVSNVNDIEGEKISIYELKNAKEEARKVVEIIKYLQEKNTPLEEICILFRAHQYSRIIKNTLEQAGIEYHSVSKSSLLKQKSVKKAIDFLTILSKLKRNSSGGEQAWWDIAYHSNFPSEDLVKIGKTIKDFSKSNKEDKKSISEYLINNFESLDLSEEGKIASKILVERIRLMLPFIEKPISELIQEIYRVSGIVQGQKTIEEKEIMLNLSKFYEIAKMHEDLYDSDLENFIYYLSILEELEIEIPAPELEESGVRLMTAHATKGLEFKSVKVTNFCQGRFPIERYHGNSLIPTELLPEVREETKSLSVEQREEFISSYERHHQMQEERRLAYVSLTRTKENLFITYAQEYSSKKFPPSQFLNEISFKINEDVSFISDLTEKSLEIQQKISSALSQEISALKTEENKKFSPSSLNLFSKCQKEFEYKYVFNMPERKTISWEAMRLGSFVHLVLERGVKNNFKSVSEFMQLSKELSLDEEWNSVPLNEAETLIKVFFERNKNKYDEKSKTEQYLTLNLSGLNFVGFADRIDFSLEGVQIVDYKTGKSAISPKDRNWQLGFYALAAKEKYGSVSKVILDMLKQDRPLEFEIDSQGNALCTSSKFIDGFNINEVKEELIETAKSIQNAYKIGFKPCPIEKNCEFCNEYVHGL